MAHEHAKEAAPHTLGKTIHWAHLYNMLFGRKPTKEHRRVLRVAAPQPGEKALDVGCGPGALAIRLAKKVGPAGQAIGIDASAEMIQLAGKKAAKEGSAARFQAAAIEALPFAAGEFDVAVSTFMLHHLPDEVQAQGLTEVRRVLKPGGRFVIADFSSESGSFLGHLLSVLGHGHGKAAFPQLEARLHDAGFTSVERIDSQRKGTMIVKAS